MQPALSLRGYLIIASRCQNSHSALLFHLSYTWFFASMHLIICCVMFIYDINDTATYIRAQNVMLHFFLIVKRFKAILSIFRVQQQKYLFQIECSVCSKHSHSTTIIVQHHVFNSLEIIHVLLLYRIRLETKCQPLTGYTGEAGFQIWRQILGTLAVFLEHRIGNRDLTRTSSGAPVIGNRKYVGMATQVTVFSRNKRVQGQFIKNIRLNMV